MSRHLLWGAGMCFVASAVPFWLWKLYIITGPAVRVLILLTVGLYALAQFFIFILGCRYIFKSAHGWVVRGFDFIALVVFEACLSMMATLGMNFVGQ